MSHYKILYLNLTHYWTSNNKHIQLYRSSLWFKHKQMKFVCFLLQHLNWLFCHIFHTVGQFSCGEGNYCGPEAFLLAGNTVSSLISWQQPANPESVALMSAAPTQKLIAANSLHTERRSNPDLHRKHIAAQNNQRGSHDALRARLQVMVRQQVKDLSCFPLELHGGNIV